MPFQIVRNDIANMHVDAVVNSANPRPIVGSGTDTHIHAKAGPKLLEARQKIGNIHVGCSAITHAYELDAKYVIHTVGPVWRGGFFGEARRLRSCYDSALQLALENNCKSIAFPLISTGNYGFPKDKALQIAISAFSEFLTEQEMQIYLVVFSREAFQLSEKLFHSVESYIDEHYVEVTECEEYGVGFSRTYSSTHCHRTQELEDRISMDLAAEKSCAPCSSMPMEAVPKKLSLEDMLKNTDAGFSETLLKLIDQTGKKESIIYKKANISKQHFSKIRSNPDYKPTKATAVAFAIALELDLEQTNDLIGRAGYTLTNSSKFDVIITYFIQEKRYDMYEINAALFHFDQMTLGV